MEADSGGRDDGRRLGSGGASVESVERTCRLVLDLEELWQEQRLDEKP